MAASSASVGRSRVSTKPSLATRLNDKGKPDMLLTIIKGRPHVVISDRNSKPRAILGMVDGNPTLVFVDENGEPTYKAP